MFSIQSTYSPQWCRERPKNPCAAYVLHRCRYAPTSQLSTRCGWPSGRIGSRLTVDGAGRRLPGGLPADAAGARGEQRGAWWGDSAQPLLGAAAEAASCALAVRDTGGPKGRGLHVLLDSGLGLWVQCEQCL